MSDVNMAPPEPDLSTVDDDELVREYLRLLDLVVTSDPIPRGVGASYDAHAEELKRRGLDLRPGVLKRWLEKAEKS